MSFNIFRNKSWKTEVEAFLPGRNRLVSDSKIFEVKSSLFECICKNMLLFSQPLASELMCLVLRKFPCQLLSLVFRFCQIVLVSTGEILIILLIPIAVITDSDHISVLAYSLRMWNVSTRMNRAGEVKSIIFIPLMLTFI